MLSGSRTGGDSAFVTGATGFTGREVVRLLRAESLRVVAHVRPDSRDLAKWRAHFASLGAEVDETPWDEIAMRASLQRVAPDLVFCLIGTTRKRGQAARSAARPLESYQTIDYGLTRLLAEAARASGHRPRFVYLSAAGASARASSPYGRARWKAEEAVRSSGLPFVIARPSFIVGADRDEPRPAEMAGAMLIDGMLAVASLAGFRRARDRYRSTSNVELARALVRLARDPACVDRVVESEDLR